MCYHLGPVQSRTHISPGGGNEVQAVLLYIICDGKCQVQHLLQNKYENTVRCQPRKAEKMARSAADLVLFAFVLLHMGTIFTRQQAFNICYWN